MVNTNLIICKTRLSLIYILAYIRKSKTEQFYELVIDEKISEKLMNYLENNKIKIIDKKDISKTKYYKLIINSYDNFIEQNQIIGSVNFTKIVFYSDLLRNGMYSFPQWRFKVDELVYFGFWLREKSFEDYLESNSEPKITIIKMTEIETVWKDLINYFGKINIVNKSLQRSSLIVMRYWGEMKPNYTFKEQLNINNYLIEEIQSQNFGERIVIRSHPWAKEGGNQIKYREIEQSVAKKIYDWNHVFDPIVEFPELNSPESLIWQNKFLFENYFGFDSSLNILVGLKNTKTKIYFPQKNIYEKYFIKPAITNKVTEQIYLQKKCIKLFRQLPIKQTKEVITPGWYYQNLITEINLDQLDAINKARLSQVSEHERVIMNLEKVNKELELNYFKIQQEMEALSNKKSIIIILKIQKIIKQIATYIHFK